MINFGDKLSEENKDFLAAFAKSCRHSILSMVNNAQSGHPGGSMSSIDYLATLYSLVISKTGEKVVVSNGHISPAVYSVLAELKYIDKEDVVKNFRRIGSDFEGHITRHVSGIEYGTGPLGIGVSVGASFAWTEKHNATGKTVYGVMGDGEAQEGQVYEMMHFAVKYGLDNYVLFCDYNEVQLTDAFEKIMPFNIGATFAAAGWNVIEIDGHDYDEIWEALSKASASEAPTLILGHTIMGKGVDFMEDDGKAHKATWHGKSPKPEMSEKGLIQLEISKDERGKIDSFVSNSVEWKPDHPCYPKLLSSMDLDTGEPILYDENTVIDCRSAYGAALLDLAKRNKKVVAMTADLRGSVKTAKVADEIPDRHIEVGIAEQHMMSFGGGLSLAGFIPFVSTFGAFMTSRAKDQARVNDINHTNVKMVATHCGLSVGEDGPTHQAIDDMGSMLGFFNTMVIEPADANQCDRIIRYIASHFGNFYVRMGRHKFPVLLKEDGTPFFDENYEYRYGRCDVIRLGTDVTVAASGALVGEALKAREEANGVSVEVVAVSSIKEFDDVLFESIRKTGRVITVEDHNTLSGLGGQLARALAARGIKVDRFDMIGPKDYQLSGKWNELYEAARIDYKSISSYF